MEYGEIRSAEHPLYPRAMELYRLSFPWHEQREEDSQRRILGYEDYHFVLVRDETRFVGLVLFWELDDLLFLEHLCVWPELRNRRYGERILTWLKGQGKPVALEADPPEDDISRRRMGFYGRCGFQVNLMDHRQMPFHAGEEPCPLVLLTWPGRISRERYAALDRCLKERVMKDVF